jgi:hypothetical protein
VKDWYALSLGSLGDASRLCEQPKKFREGRDCPDVDRIDNAATCKVGGGTAQKPGSANHDAATADDANYLDLPALQDGAKSDVTQDSPVAEKNRSGALAQNRSHSPARD